MTMYARTFNVPSNARSPSKNKSANAKTMHRDRWLTVGLCPDAAHNKPWIRIHGLWLEEAGFTPQTRVRVRVMQGCLIVTAE